jgi:hypothetical protein
MKNIISSILLLSIVVALILSVVIPCAEEMKNTGTKSFNVIKI